jgi:hypothetical protein
VNLLPTPTETSSFSDGNREVINDRRSLAAAVSAGTAPIVYACLDLRGHLLRLSHHVTELGKDRFEFVIAEGHDAILIGTLLNELVSFTCRWNGHAG